MNGYWWRAMFSQGQHFVPNGDQARAICGKEPPRSSEIKWVAPRHADVKCQQCVAIIKQVKS